MGGAFVVSGLAGCFAGQDDDTEPMLPGTGDEETDDEGEDEDELLTPSDVLFIAADGRYRIGTNDDERYEGVRMEGAGGLVLESDAELKLEAIS